jgi:hypothetical protein
MNLLIRRLIRPVPWGAAARHNIETALRYQSEQVRRSPTPSLRYGQRVFDELKRRREHLPSGCASGLSGRGGERINIQ